MRHKNGFSLLEVIIVMAIIAILFLITGLAYFNILAKTRDSRRMADVVAINKSLKIHQAQKGSFPQADEWIKLEEDLNNNGALSQLLREYISPYPQDPFYPLTLGTKVYSYQYRSTALGKGYKLHIERENGGAYEYSDGDGSGLIYNP